MTAFLVEEIKELKREIKNLKLDLKINTHYCTDTVKAIKEEIANYEKLVRSYERSLLV